MVFTFSAEAKQRIAELGAGRISEFLDEISLVHRQRIYEPLPDIPGFQKKKNNPNLTREKGKRLATAIAHSADPKARSVGLDWSVYGAAWAFRGVKLFGEGFPKPPFDFANADSAACIAFLRQLVPDVYSPPCPREDVQRFVTFSGMRMSDEVLNFIALVPTKIEVERQKALVRIQADVAKLTSELSEVSKSVAQQHASIELVQADVRQATNDAHQAITETTRISSQVEKLSHPVSSPRNQLDSDRFADTLENLEDSHARLNAQLDELRKSLSRDKSQTAKTEKAIEEVRASYKETQLAVARAEQRIEEAVRQVEKGREIVSGGTSNDDLGLHRNSEVAIAATARWTLRAKGRESVNLSSWDEGLTAVEHNLTAIGVLPSFAMGLSRVVVSSAAAGLMLQLKGSVADVVAAAVAEALGGDNQLVWQVPLGLCDEALAQSSMATLSAAVGNGKCLLIRGANRSAFEIYGGALRDVVLDRTFNFRGSNSDALLVATWAEGPAVIPGGTPLLELGPVIDVDAVDWKSNAKLAPLKTGALVLDGAAVRATASRSTEETRLAMEVVDAIGVRPNALWRRSFHKFVSILFNLPNMDYVRDFELASLNWLVPWAKMQGGGREQVQNALKSISPEHANLPSIVSVLNEADWASQS
ncbi:hypothetical protein PQQ51_31065 [Paraburkholderia xenovorans]|uniref:hypothetical protein n=1 Tax=Paraburkholderia xenovorans TaxID=36873 RepID=UPI0038BDEE4D